MLTRLISAPAVANRWGTFQLRQRQILGEHFRRRNASTAAPVVQRRLASDAASMVARRSRASKSISPWINTASRWRSMSRQRTSMGLGNAVRRYSKGIVPVLHQLAGFKGTALGDLSYRGQRLSKAGKALGITVEPSAGGGTFIPEGIRWVVEHSFAWFSRYRRLR